MFVIEPLERRHDKADFSCGTEALDVYLQRQAGQDFRRNIASVFVAVENGSDKVIGYYTLAAAEIPYMRLRNDEQKAMPHYGNLPAIRLGRLAVDVSFQGRMLGILLLTDAMNYSLCLPIAWQFFLVDAKESAADFYKKFGFVSCIDNDKILYLTRKNVVKFSGAIKK
ncbi:MAG: GNAT family N-acetyltransferase [Synergistaceae bacterium]|nr:GNAT family N-acetyltransferase [Synergistaceae bacterium]